MTARGAARVAAAVLVAAVIAALAFLFRFNPLGGTLGGFDNDHFVHLLRTDMLLNGEQPLRDFAESELRGAWPSLGYATSAWAQQWWGRTLLAEAYLTVGLLAAAAGGTFLLALHLGRRWLLAMLAAVAVVVAHPKLYNYEKVVVLFVGLALVRFWVLKPSWWRVALLSAWTAVATLFRHDFGVYVAVAAAAAFLVYGPASIPLRVGRVAVYAAMTVILLIPSIVWVEQYAGIVPYVQRTLETVTAESARTRLGWPRLDTAAGLGQDNLVTLTYYTFWLIPALAAVALAAVSRRAGVQDIATGAALLACTIAVNWFFLRGNLVARFGDAIIPVVLLAAWTVAAFAPSARGRASRQPAAPRVEAGWLPRPAALALSLVPAGLLLLMTTAMFVAGEMTVEVQASGLAESREMTGKRFAAARNGLARMPPEVWTDSMSQGTLAAARYLAECTAPGDRVLLATYAPEVPVFARRLVAAGQGTFGLAFYESDVQQREAVERLREQSVPVVIGSYDDFEGEFASDYRLVHAYVAEHYTDAGPLPSGAVPRFRVLVAADRQPRGTHPLFGLPCFK